jgi:hypothetical protein
MTKTHQDMSASSKISIWLGDISDELELDEYLSDQFAADFGFEIYPPAGPECTAQEPADVRDLLEGFSQWRQFIDAAIVKAKAIGINQASCAVIFYNFAYDTSLIQNDIAPIHFIGTIAYSAS